MPTTSTMQCSSGQSHRLLALFALWIALAISLHGMACASAPIDVVHHTAQAASIIKSGNPAPTGELRRTAHEGHTLANDKQRAGLCPAPSAGDALSHVRRMLTQLASTPCIGTDLIEPLCVTAGAPRVHTLPMRGPPTRQ